MSLKDNLISAFYNPALAISAGQKYLRQNRLGRSLKRYDFNLPPAAGSDVPDAEACVHQLARTVGVLRLSNESWRQWIGVSDEVFAPVLEALFAMAPEATAHSVRNAVSYDRQQALVQNKVRIRLNGLAGEPVIDLERYLRKSSHHWVSANPKNAVARAVFGDYLSSPGLTEAQHLLDGPWWGQERDALPIDIVCTWVNHGDPGWKRQYAEHAGTRPTTTDAASRTRFQSNNELLYLLRSISWNLPWHGTIHIVSNCAPPEWLDVSHPDIRWVPHEAILPPEYLPTFNSHTIETALHGIPGLSEHFIYANDDMFFCRPRDKALFFRADGASSAFLENAAMVSGEIADGEPDYLNASRRSASLIQSRFGVRPTRLHKHVPYALRRSVLEEIERSFPEAIGDTRRNRFRAVGDVNMTSFLYQHYALLKGQAQATKIKNLFVRSSDLRWRKELKRMEKRKLDVLCLNEGGRVTPGRDWTQLMHEKLSSMFGHIAPWEIR